MELLPDIYINIAGNMAGKTGWGVSSAGRVILFSTGHYKIKAKNTIDSQNNVWESKESIYGFSLWNPKFLFLPQPILRKAKISLKLQNI